MVATLDKKADLAGPGIGDYKELEKMVRLAISICQVM